MRLNNKGFTLIEIMMVVVIIGIMATIAIPSYQGYMKRAKFSEVMMSVYSHKIAIEMVVQSGRATQLADLDGGAFGIPEDDADGVSDYVASINVENGVITATGTDDVDGETFVITPSADGSGEVTVPVIWDDSSSSCKTAGMC